MFSRLNCSLEFFYFLKLKGEIKPLISPSAVDSLHFSVISRGFKVKHYRRSTN